MHIRDHKNLRISRGHVTICITCVCDSCERLLRQMPSLAEVLHVNEELPKKRVQRGWQTISAPARNPYVLPRPVRMPAPLPPGLYVTSPNTFLAALTNNSKSRRCTSGLFCCRLCDQMKQSACDKNAVRSHLHCVHHVEQTSLQVPTGVIAPRTE